MNYTRKLLPLLLILAAATLSAQTWDEIPFNQDLSPFTANNGATWSAQQSVVDYSDVVIGGTVHLSCWISGSSLTAGATELRVGLRGSYRSLRMQGGTVAIADFGGVDTPLRIVQVDTNGPAGTYLRVRLLGNVAFPATSSFTIRFVTTFAAAAPVVPPPCPAGRCD